VVGRATDLLKIPAPFIPQDTLPDQLEEESHWGNLADLEKDCKWCV